MSRVRDILKIKGETVWHLTPDASLNEALKLLKDKDVGALLVLEKNKVVGIFSERDYVRRAATSKEFFSQMQVRDLMTKNVFFVTPDESIEGCMSLMTEKRIRHLPVISEGQLSGIISIGDIVSRIIYNQKNSIEQLEKYITGRNC